MNAAEINAQNKPIIYFVWNYLEWGGGQIYLLAIMKSARRDWRVKAVLPAGSSEQIVEFIRQIGVEYEFIDAHLDLQPAPTLKRKIERHYRKLRCEFRTVRYLRRQRYDALHIDIAPWQSLVALLFLLRRSSVFMTMHNRLPAIARWRFWSWKIKLAVLAATKRFHLFTSNRDTKESLKKLLPEKFRQNIKITYTAVDEAEIARALETRTRRDELLAKYNLPVDKFLVFCVGQFIDRKGRWDFLRAAETVGKTNKNVHFVWITNSKITANERRKIAEYDLGARFCLFESDKYVKERAELLALIAQADLFALPSYVEGLPAALVEAMALEVPSISTNVNAIPEAIIHNETGWLIEPGDTRALAEAILTAAADADLRTRVARAGRRRALDNFNEKISAQTAINEYFASLPGDNARRGAQTFEPNCVDGRL